ncbi:AlbA family DNA-binding domain-containing protein [Nonomuraea dietziae]|uniref:AlbA family DNA-binding domain-containing protein n=1 Tax=Nonomuraea dietziae TaxID=65515 RepID=UPI0033D3FBF6
MELLSRYGVPDHVVLREGLEQLVQSHTAETRHLDFKRQLGSPEDLADDITAMVNSGGGVLIIGVDTDKADRAATLHDHDLRTMEQRAVQAAREGVDEPIRIDPVPVPSQADPSIGQLVIIIPPSDRIPHLSVKRGRILHRVGTHNKPMTRREVGAAFALSGAAFAREFGLISTGEPAAIAATAYRNRSDPTNGIVRVINRGGETAYKVTVTSSVCPLEFDSDLPVDSSNPKSFIRRESTPEPPYLPLVALPPGAEVKLNVVRSWGASTHDVLTFTWEDRSGSIHQATQAVSWEPPQEGGAPW